MGPRYKQKITVIKKLSSKDVFGESLPEVADEIPAYCDRFEVGEEFTVDESGAKPADFCTWAWHDIFPVITALRVGGSFPWMKKDGMVYACCTDGARPVFFKIERV